MEGESIDQLSHTHQEEYKNRPSPHNLRDRSNLLERVGKKSLLFLSELIVSSYCWINSTGMLSHQQHTAWYI